MFPLKILDTQDDDVLYFPYRFTRMITKKLIVLGLKQESILKLRQCIEQSEEAAIYLVREEKVSMTAKKCNIHDLPSTSQESRQDNKHIPQFKKGKVSQQPTH